MIDIPTWHVQPIDGFPKETNEAHDNALMIASLLMGRGWSLKSVCAVLGNIQGESGMNPWRWESDNYWGIPTYNEAWGWTPAQLSEHGYGFFQYTWFTTYAREGSAYPGFGINYQDRAGSDLDGQCQILYMDNDLDNPSSAYGWNTNHFDEYNDVFLPEGIDISTFYYMPISDFRSGANYTLDELTAAFQLCYERPRAIVAYGGYLFRKDIAQYYYDYLSTQPIPPYPLGGSHKFNWIYYMKPRRKRLKL